MAKATDNFDRADSASLGANWTTIPGRGAPRIVSNQALCQSDGTDSDAVNTSITPGNDQYAQAQVMVWTTAAPIAVVTRGSIAATTFYHCGVYAPAGVTKFTVLRALAGAFSGLGQTNATIVAGDTVRQTMIGSAMTNTLNGAFVSGLSDSNIASGYPGMGGDDATCALNNWEGGDVIEDITANTLPVDSLAGEIL